MMAWYQSISNSTARGLIWAQGCYPVLQQRFSQVGSFFSHYAYKGYNWGQVYLWPPVKTIALKAGSVVGPYREEVGFGVAGGVIAIVAYLYWRSLPQKPDVTFKTELNFATLQVKVPKGAPASPNVNLIFCVDTSGSMSDHGRIDAVRRALNTLLNNAEKKVKDAGAKISIAITAFTDVSRVICEPAKLSDSGSVQLRTNIANMNCNGGTNILNGLTGAQEKLNAMARTNPLARHTVVLLTDGGNDVSDPDLKKLHEQFAKIKAQFFAIGISNHDKDVLKNIAVKMNGTYIDTSNNQDTIESSIHQIYQQAVASFQEVTLTSNLKGHCWSVDKMQQVGEFKLGSISEGQEINRKITIHGESLAEPIVDLSEVSFYLNYVDPEGKKGRIELPWNHTSMMSREFMRKFVS